MISNNSAKDYSNMLAFDMNEKKPQKSDFTFFNKPKQAVEKPAEEQKIFDLKSLDLNKE